MQHRPPHSAITVQWSCSSGHHTVQWSCSSGYHTVQSQCSGHAAAATTQCNHSAVVSFPSPRTCPTDPTTVQTPADQTCKPATCLPIEARTAAERRNRRCSVRMTMSLCVCVCVCVCVCGCVCVNRRCSVRMTMSLGKLHDETTPSVRRGGEEHDCARACELCSRVKFSWWQRNQRSTCVEARPKSNGRVHAMRCIL
jgi:hypothetical protein